MYPSTDIRQIKAAIRDQAFIGRTLVWCPMGRVVAVRKRKGQLLAMIRGWGVRWYTVESVSIETQFVLPASPVFLGARNKYVRMRRTSSDSFASEKEGMMDLHLCKCDNLMA